MLLLGKTKSHVNRYLVITLVDTRCIWKLSKSPLLSCLWQLSYVLLRCVLIFGSPPHWLLILWLPLLAISPLHSACSYDPICATWNFTLGVWSVMVLWVATMLPRWNREPPVGAHTRLCCSALAGIEVPSHDRLQNYTDVLFSHELFLGYLSLSCQKICMSNQIQ